jgi:hypothetical protein
MMRDRVKLFVIGTRYGEGEQKNYCENGSLRDAFVRDVHD